MRAKVAGLLFLLGACLATAAPGPVPVRLRLFPLEATVTLDGQVQAAAADATGTRLLSVPAGEHVLALAADGYLPRTLCVSWYGETHLELKLEREASGLRRLDGMDTGRQPKSISYTPDGRYLLVPLLDDTGIDVLWSGFLARFARIAPPAPWAARGGFVETAFLPGRGEVWVSQMTTGMIHAFSLADFSWRASFPAGGSWPKVICVAPDEAAVWVSNWESRDVTEIDPATRTVVGRIDVGGTPRGLAYDPGTGTLWVCIYDAARIVKVDTRRRAVTRVLDFGTGAMRHIVLDSARGVLYASDMHAGSVTAIDAATDRVLATVRVDRSLNTIALSPDGATLYVSSRGPNNPDDYTLKGPAFGKVYALDTAPLRVRDWTWGGNQPTGLAVSPDGRRIVFTNFLDDTVEMYAVAGS